MSDDQPKLDHNKVMEYAEKMGLKTDFSEPSQDEQNAGEDYTEEFINNALEGIAKDYCDKKRALELLSKIDEGQCGIKAWDLICDAKDYLNDTKQDK